MRTTVIAIGGNSLLRKGQKGELSEQQENALATCRHLLPIIAQRKVLITHGNGPQVGAILIQNEKTPEVPGMPLDACGAQSQGLIGYIIQQALTNTLMKKGLDLGVASVVTQVYVDGDDPAFENPSKPVGPYMKRTEALRNRKERGWAVREIEGGRGWRRLVPSPQPRGIVEANLIKNLFKVSGKSIIIAAGGGGIPVKRTPEGFVGVEAVIDKDFASLVLALQIEADTLILLTDEECAYLDYGKTKQKRIGKASASKMGQYLKAGHFPPGSMGPKVEACIDFVKSGGAKAIITNAESLGKAVKGKAGTTVTH